MPRSPSPMHAAPVPAGRGHEVTAPRCDAVPGHGHLSAPAPTGGTHAAVAAWGGCGGLRPPPASSSSSSCWQACVPGMPGLCQGERWQQVGASAGGSGRAVAGRVAGGAGG